MTQSKHTPTPWIVKEGMIYSEKAATGKTIATAGDDDGEFIVKAVNSYDIMLESITIVYEMLYYRDDEKGDDNQAMLELLQEAINKAR